VSLTGTLTCHTVNGGTPISPTLPDGSYTIDGSSCSGLSSVPSGYTIAYVGVTNGFVVSPTTITVMASGSQTFGSSSPSFTYTDNAPGGVSLTGTLTCHTVNGGTLISPTLPVGLYTIDGSSCSGLSSVPPGYTIAYSGVTNGFVVSATVPGPPTIGAASSPSPGSAVVNFSAPASDGGSPILGYTATCFSLDSQPAVSAPGLGSPITVTGLVAGTPYECSVTATNVIGTGPPSALSNVIGLPSPSGGGNCTTTPSAPYALSQAPGPSSAVVSWAPPKTGAPCVAGYLVTPYLGSVAQLSILILGHGTTTVLSGLVNGVTYRFTVTAENGHVEGPPSVLSGSVTAGAPGAATVLHIAKVAKGALKVAFAVPAQNGAPITRYTATCISTNGGKTRTKTGTAGPLTVTGLTTGKTYVCSITATNKRGAGPKSRPSAPVKA